MSQRWSKHGDAYRLEGQALRQFIGVLTGLGLALVIASGAASQAQQKPATGVTTSATASVADETRRARLAAVKTWGYQLRQIVPSEIAASPYDLMVVDYSNDRRFYMEWPLPPADVATMQKRPAGTPGDGRRIMLSYLSVGEAEDYRNYWQWEWLEKPANRPSWLGKENPEWEGNYPVKFWESGWQALMFGGPEKYLDSIIRAGFDGVYLDRVDVYGEWAKQNPKAEANMITFIERLSAYARRLNPEFMIIIQNGEELVRHAAVRKVIDGVAKESLFYGLNGPDVANPESEVGFSLGHLRTARKAGGLVLLVEYAKSDAARALITQRAKAEGLPLLLTHRDLGDGNQPEKPPGSPTSPRGNN
jgi:cysteinyl-tRNA synthetase, unknown class